MEKLNCEICGRSEFSKDGDFFVCDNCRTKYTTVQARSLMAGGTLSVDRSRELQNLLKLAQTALDADNADEAYGFANRVLEIDSQNVEGWLLKGKAAGWSSTISDFRIKEMFTSFQEAEKLTLESERESLRKDCAQELNRVAVAVHNISWNYTVELVPHAVERVQRDSTWSDHVERCKIVTAVLQASYEWGKERSPLDNIVIITSNLIRGIKYKDSEGLTRVVSLSTAEHAEMQELIDSTSEEIRKFDNSYLTPRPIAQKASKIVCFVVTATMGSEQNFPVFTLRKFRDQILKRSNLGRSFINWYGIHGPNYASVIAQSYVLRGLSFVFIVVPATAMAWIVLALSREHDR